jgi:hypothetical protein
MNMPANPPTITGRLEGSIPVAGAHIRRTPLFLLLGHFAILVATIPIAALLVSHALTDEAGAPFGGLPIVVMFAIGAIALAIGQVLSVHRLRALARATTDHIDVDQVARSLRRSAWSTGLALYTIIFGAQFLLTAPARPFLSALFLLMLIASLLLDHMHAGWLHHRLNEHGASAEYRLLPPGIGPRIRSGQPVAAFGHAAFSGIAALLFVATVVTESRSATGVMMLVQVLAAAATIAVPLLHIRAIRLVRTAIVGDFAHLPTLRRAGQSFIHAGRAAALLTAIVIASVLATPAAPMVAVGRAALLAFVLCVATLQFASLSSIHIGDFPKRWTGEGKSGHGPPP